MLLFKAKDLKPVLQEAIAHQCDVLLVKDQSIYIMSDIGSMQNGKYLVAYACGYHPEKDEGWYERAWEEAGGDDFAEKLGFSISTLNRLLNDKCDLKVTLTATQIITQFYP
ncbi:MULTISPECIES: DUF3085 domain-containing protein [Photorhabdus]|uniref:DUF3085 domain-containing protein n=2 Tax=Photorhabdus asymbiotica TaxID=291112 RepID=B6VNI4_PHOAA|nr:MULTISPECIES: DUF3085 domain-containing protein [Photorhabdus]RKS58260.1 DUF3085 family protein [Photorhabdus asymbiotica]CAQ85385.1 conserved hypothetical protein [Photorhabdus asymbiotica]CAR67714.1 Hypothetical protein PA-RVA20-21-0103 [Photorhabdus asymbiotica subsp. asymbiotica ATCC 43949]